MNKKNTIKKDIIKAMIWLFERVEEKTPIAHKEAPIKNKPKYPHRIAPKSTF